MQVRAKAQALNQFLRSMQGPGRAYTLLQLSRRLLSYCEAQVALSHSSAFAVAEVTASVLGMHADFAPILLGKLHEVSRSLTALSFEPYSTAMGYLLFISGHGGHAVKPQQSFWQWSRLVVGPKVVASQCCCA